MLFVDNRNITDPHLNLALEEFLLRGVDLGEPLLLFYVNAPSVIIGRNQNTLEEIDPDYVAAHEVNVVRRLSGGGAVYHDLGNLNFSFVTPDREHLHDFGRFTEPVIQVLRALGVPAELRGKSDIFAADKKISGNAQYASGGRMFSHGTLLFDTDLAAMLHAINPRQVQIESRAVQSVRHFVTNIRELLPQDMTLADLQQALLDGLFPDATVPTFDLSPAQWEEVKRLAESRYRTWEWNVGRSPQFNVQKSARFDGVGKVDVRIDVAHGRVQDIAFFGDFNGRQDVAGLVETLRAVRYTPEDLAQALASVDLAAYFGPLERDALLALLF